MHAVHHTYGRHHPPRSAPRRPTGKSIRLRIFVCPVPFSKIFRFRRRANQIYNSRRPVPQRGVAQRHERGAGCGGRGCAFGRRALRRTEKSCGPDTPTLVSSLRMQVRRRRWQESPVAGESTKETVKTIARGMPGDFRRDRGDYARVLTSPFAREAAGASSARHSLRPLIEEGGIFKIKLGRIRPRDREAVSAQGGLFEIRIDSSSLRTPMLELRSAPLRNSYSSPDSSSSACSISSSLTTTLPRGTRKIIVEAQTADNTTMAMLSGTGVPKWPPR